MVHAHIKKIVWCILLIANTIMPMDSNQDKKQSVSLRETITQTLTTAAKNPYVLAGVALGGMVGFLLSRSAKTNRPLLKSGSQEITTKPEKIRLIEYALELEFDPSAKSYEEQREEIEKHCDNDTNFMHCFDKYVDALRDNYEYLEDIEKNGFLDNQLIKQLIKQIQENKKITIHIEFNFDEMFMNLLVLDEDEQQEFNNLSDDAQEIFLQGKEEERTYLLDMVQKLLDARLSIQENSPTITFNEFEKKTRVQLQEDIAMMLITKQAKDEQFQKLIKKDKLFGSLKKKSPKSGKQYRVSYIARNHFRKQSSTNPIEK